MAEQAQYFNRILISPTAINFLPALVWHGLVLVYFLQQRAKSKPTWLFTGWMLGLTLITVASFLSRLIYAPLGGYIYWIGGLLSAYLPLIVNNFAALPDLVVDSVTTGLAGPSVTLRNAGTVATSNAFWGDVYFNPGQAPSLNQP